jgi:SAM-dependent methyltransferase
MTTNDAPTDAPHSALYMSDGRDLWWNEDFLALIATRVNLAAAQRVLDCGAGQGHWTRTIARLLPRGAEVIGLEREPEWVARASQGPATVGDGVSLRFQQGDVTALPFEAASFDVVTCQTLLIHLADPRNVVREMVRVLRPGGLLLVCEPNNLAEGIARLAVSPSFDLEGAVAWFRLEALCEKGKHALGLGYNSLGEGVVSLFDPALLDNVRVWNNDKCQVYLPQEGGAARALRQEIIDERRILSEGAVGWSREETRRYFLAGGGIESEFDALVEKARDVWRRRLDALEGGEIAQNGGGLFYVATARKRSGASS